MNVPYTVTTEEDAPLFDRRIRLAELTILTITALMVILSFTKNNQLLVPIALLSVDLIMIIIIIIAGANKIKKETHFGDTSVDATKKDISYTLHWSDIITFIIYGISILSMLLILQ